MINTDIDYEDDVIEAPEEGDLDEDMHELQQQTGLPVEVIRWAA